MPLKCCQSKSNQKTKTVTKTVTKKENPTPHSRSELSAGEKINLLLIIVYIYATYFAWAVVDFFTNDVRPEKFQD